MATGDGFEGGFEIGIGLDTIHLRRFDERSDASPGGGPFIVTGKQRILASESQGPDAIFHGIGVDLDASVVEKDLQALPVAVEVGEFLAQAGFGGNARALFSGQTPKAWTRAAERVWRTWRRCSAEVPRISASMA